MEKELIKRVEAREYQCVAGFLQNDMDWIRFKDEKRQAIALEFAKALIISNAEYLHGNIPQPVPDAVAVLAFEFADSFISNI